MGMKSSVSSRRQTKKTDGATWEPNAIVHGRWFVDSDRHREAWEGGHPCAELSGSEETFVWPINRR